MKRALLALGLSLLAVGCAGTAKSIEDLFSGPDLPGEYVQTLRAVHVKKSWTLRPDVRDALATAREAVRGLATAEYANWRESAFAVQVLSSVAEEHPVSLMRVEALDALADVAPWLLRDEVKTGDWATESEMIGALRILREAAEADAETPKPAFEVADAVRTVAAFGFEEGTAFRETDPRTLVARVLKGRLRNTRGVLMPFTGNTLNAYRTDPEVREAMDKACSSLAAKVLRLTLVTAAIRDPSETSRSVAVDHLGTVRWPGGADVLRRVVRSDTSSKVRREAAQSLGNFEPAESVEALIDALGDDMTTVRGAASRALRIATGKDFGDDRRAWARWWAAHTPATPTDSSK